MSPTTSSPRSPGYSDALARLNAYRYTRSPAPRVRVRAVDPIVRRSLLVLWAGLLLILLGHLLDPLTLLDSHTEE